MRDATSQPNSYSDSGCEAQIRQALPPTLTWHGDADGWLELLDQTLLPHRVEVRRCRTSADVWQAIKELCVRGAPAIGVAGAYGLCLGSRSAANADRDSFLQAVAQQAEYLNAARPTAVNLSWALKRVCGVAQRSAARGSRALWQEMLDEAHAMAREDAAVCRAIGEHGAKLIRDGATVLTHCNAGALATVAYGTATSLMYAAREQGRRFRVLADETRPLLQGARLTSLELSAAGIDVTVLCDGAAASQMAAGAVDLVVVGADRIAANGDTANKIGTLSVAVAAAHFKVPFYVAAPWSTFDLSIGSGAEIPIEQRSEVEIRSAFGVEMVPAGVRCLNPAFDVTPAALIRGIITETGVLEPVSESEIRRNFPKNFPSQPLQRG